MGDNMGKELLVACCVCKRIRIDGNADYDDRDGFWLSREQNPEGYDSIMRDYKDKISHGYCPQHLEEAMKEVEEFKEAVRKTR